MTKDQYGRKDRLIQERRHDVYYRRNKLASPACCSQCGLMFINGRWLRQETAPSDEADLVLCPACRRIADNYPAGYVEVRGPFFQSHRQQIVNLIRNIEEREKDDRPLERIMDISEGKITFWSQPPASMLPVVLGRHLKTRTRGT